MFWRQVQIVKDFLPPKFGKSAYFYLVPDFHYCCSASWRSANNSQATSSCDHASVFHDIMRTFCWNRLANPAGNWDSLNSFREQTIMFLSCQMSIVNAQQSYSMFFLLCRPPSCSVFVVECFILPDCPTGPRAFFWALCTHLFIVKLYHFCSFHFSTIMYVLWFPPQFVGWAQFSLFNTFIYFDMLICLDFSFFSSLSL